MLRQKKGQSTLEYVLLVVGCVVAFIAFTQAEGWGLRPAIKETLSESAESMTNMSERLSNSYGTQPVRNVDDGG